MLRRYVLCGLFGSIRLKGKQITVISKKEKRNKQFFLFPIFNLDNEVGFMTLSALFFFFFRERSCAFLYLDAADFCESRDGGGVEL